MSQFGKEWIVIEVNRQYFALSARCVLELLDQSGMTVVSFPGCQPPLVGMLEHRGNVLPVIDTRLVLGLPTFEEELAEINGTLDTQKASFSQWADELRTRCTTGGEFTQSTELKETGFGAWFEGMEKSTERRNVITGGDPSLDSIIKTFSDPIRSAFAGAAEALVFASSGDFEASTARFEQLWNNEISVVLSTFDRLWKAIEDQHRPRLAISQANGKSGAFLVDGVETMIMVDESEIQTVEQGISRSPSIIGVYTNDRFGEIFLIDGVSVLNKLQDVPSEIPSESFESAPTKAAA